MTVCLQCRREFTCLHAERHEKGEGCVDAGAALMRHVAEISNNGGSHDYDPEIAV